MHGRKREQYKAQQRDPSVVSKLAAKAQQWHILVGQVLSSKDNESQQQQQQQQLALTEKMLLVNPDPLYLWNIRRRILSMSLQQSSDSNGANNHVANHFSLTTELGLTQAALENNPKAYGAWLHRKWVLSLHPDAMEPTVLQNELQLIQIFLQKDERNFHGWNYRRFIVSLLLGESSNEEDDIVAFSTSPQIVVATREEEVATHEQGRPKLSSAQRDEILQTEWDFTNQKIQENFSNYSAFHYRTQLFPWKLQVTSDLEKLMTEEWTMIMNAVFTEPDDQTAWWYAQYLLQYGPRELAFYPKLIQMQVILPLRELVEEVPESKWVRLGLYLLLDAFPDPNTLEERKQCLETLICIDADRKARYQYLLRTLEQK